ncbi:hypothetical protein JXB31_00590 [Candidatus Woesearchaeota archaeon]|nr:hypothetical protein [Candidatus Woesearchaeota archaeon]
MAKVDYNNKNRDDYGNKRSTISNEYADPTINLALDTIKKEKQALIFTNTKRSAEKAAEDIAAKIKPEAIASEKTHLEQIAEKVLSSLHNPTRQCQRLSMCIKKGTAFHHAGLTQKQKEIIQDEFSKGRIKIIAATPTLAAGVDLPAFRTILKDLRRFTPTGLQFIPVLEYLQMAGRAGRPKFDSFGEAIAVAKTEQEKARIWKKYIKGEPEEIYSKLAAEPALRFYLLSLIAGDFVRTKDEIIDFFQQTFWAHQYGNLERLEAVIDKMLMLLSDFGFIIQKGKKGCAYDSSEADFIDAHQINKEDNKEKYKATQIGKRVSELYLDPLTAYSLINAEKKADIILKNSTLVPYSFLQMIAYTLELRPLLRVKAKEYDDIMERFANYEDCIITTKPTAFDIDYDEFLNSVKTAMLFEDWTNEKTEDVLLEEYDIRPGELKAKLDIADWLTYSSIELAKILGYKEVSKELAKIRTRLKYGVKEELLALLKLKNIGRARARKLYKNGLKDISAVKKADITTLRTLIGARTAEGIKEQLGQKVEKASPNKRKGQKNLEDY